MIDRLKIISFAFVAFMALCAGVARGAEAAACDGDVEMPAYVKVQFAADTCRVDVLIDDDEFDNIAGKVTFPINKYALPANDRLLKEIEQTVIPVANSNDWKLVGVMVKGSASPDGPLSHNQVLGDSRAQSIIDFINSKLDCPAVAPIAVENMGEDYALLVYLMDRASDADASRVRNIVRRPGATPASIKQELRIADGGNLWHRISAKYFPEMRAARVVFIYRSAKQDESSESLPQVEDITIIDENAEEHDLVEDGVVDTAAIAVDQESDDADQRVKCHLLALKTNVLMDVFYMPNYGWAPAPDVQLELYPARRIGILAQFTFPYWEKPAKHKYFKIHNFRIEGR